MTLQQRDVLTNQYRLLSLEVLDRGYFTDLHWKVSENPEKDLTGSFPGFFVEKTEEKLAGQRVGMQAKTIVRWGRKATDR